MSPIRIQAEDYLTYKDSTTGNSGGVYRNNGVDIQRSLDSDNGYSIGWTDAGEFLTYSIDITEAGTYRLDARVASNVGGNHRFQVSIDEQTSNFALGYTGGWHSWEDISGSQEISLAAGIYQVRVDILTDGFNLNYLDLTQVNTNTTTNTNSGSNNKGNIRIQAEDYLTYKDSTAGNFGGVYRNNGVDIQRSLDSDNGYSIGWTDAGEFLTYSIDITEAGTYRLDARVASYVGGNHRFQVSIDGKTSNFGLGYTGGWHSWKDISGSQEISLAAGTYQVRIDILTDGFNLNYLDLTRVGAEFNPTPTPETITLNFGNNINGGNGRQINGTAGIDTVNYSQLSTGINANLNTGTVTYELTSSTGDTIEIMPLGDSITEGFLASDFGGYRDDLWGLLTDNGYNVDFVGDRSRGSGDFDRDHAGVSGERIEQVANRINGLLSTYQPDAVLLMIGTNDNIQSFDFGNAPNRLNNLVNQITSQSPNTHVFLGSIPPDKNSARQQQVINFNAQIPGIANNYANVTFVDIFSQMNQSDLEDDVHPTPSGNNKIAQAWYDAIGNVYGSGAGNTTYTDTLSNIENIIGSDYDDTLVGNNNANIFFGRGGNDSITGGGGRDQFVLTSAAGTDTIRDFQVGEDLLVLEDGLTYGQINIAAGSTFGYGANDTLILGNNNQQLAILSGVQSNSINANSFAIA